MPAPTIASISHDLFTMGIPVVEKAVRTGAVYLGLVVLLRIAGKRDLAQLNSGDLVVLLLLSNVVQNAVIGEDNSLVGGLLGAAVLIACNSALVRVSRRSELMVRLFEGSPTTVVRDGQIDRSAIRRLGLRAEDVITALRRQGANTIEEVAEATLEPGGTISVRLRPPDENATKGDIRRLEEKLDAVARRLNR